MIPDDLPDLDLHAREYVCDECRLVHWQGAPASGWHGAY